MEGSFKFKRFEVRNVDSAMKVGTDGVLLGAAVDLDPVRDAVCAVRPADPAGKMPARPVKVLDIGTGTGVVSLILAQRLEQLLDPLGRHFQIQGIDVDEAAAAEAAFNFAASPWGESLQSTHRALQDFADDLYLADSESDIPSHRIDPFSRGIEQFSRINSYDLIVSNPPYYDESLPAPDPQRSTARHTESLSYREVITFAHDFLAPEGRLAIILPKQEEPYLLRFAVAFGLVPTRILSVHTSDTKPAKRLVAEFSRTRVPVVKEDLTIMSGGEYTAEYKNITKDFYLNF